MDNDKNPEKTFVDFLLTHKIKVYQNGEKYTVPLKQPQHRMVLTMFEIYDKYRDSVFYDASAWSLANFYNVDYKGLKSVKLVDEVISTDAIANHEKINQASYTYILDWDDYNSPAALYYLQSKGLKLASAFKPFSINTSSGTKDFNYGSLLLPISKQKFDAVKVY